MLKVPLLEGDGTVLLTFEPIDVLPDATRPEGEKDGKSWTSRIFSALPYGVFAALFASTYKRWFLPFQDHAREVMVPERLLHGEVLYRDIGSSYGPLPPYLDALALRLFGEHLDVLIALRTVIALLGVAALMRLSKRLVRRITFV